jgi:ribosomal-protein-alanine N-acetyltransferase
VSCAVRYLHRHVRREGHDLLLSELLTTAPDTLRTERLCLRRFVPEDRARYVAIRSEPEVAERLGHRVDEAAARTDWFLERSEWNWRERGLGPWAVTVADEVVGHAGFWYLENFSATELMYGYTRRVWGRGFATEAGRAIVSLAFGTLGLDRLIALTAHSNLASRRVLEKLGFLPIREGEHRGFPVIVHEITPPGRATGAP